MFKYIILIPGIRSRATNNYDSTANLNLSDSSLISSTKINNTSQSFFSTESGENVEARQNIINNICMLIKLVFRYCINYYFWSLVEIMFDLFVILVSKEQSERSSWMTIRSLTRTCLTLVNRTIIMSFSAATKAVTSLSEMSNLRIPFLLLIFLLPFLFFSILGLGNNFKIT